MTESRGLDAQEGMFICWAAIKGRMVVAAKVNGLKNCMLGGGMVVSDGRFCRRNHWTLKKWMNNSNEMP